MEKFAEKTQEMGKAISRLLAHRFKSLYRGKRGVYPDKRLGKKSAKENHRFPFGKRWFYGCGERT